MRHYGVVYDVGLRFDPDRLSVEPYDQQLVDHDMRVIAEQLHANAVRIEGEDIPRLVTASQSAHKMGLSVYFNPWKMNAGIDDTRDYLVEAATAAEQLRQSGVDIVFVTSCEFSIFCDGIYPGSTVLERVAWMAGHMYTAPGESMAEAAEVMAEKAVELNAALRSFVQTTRAHFAGPVTYSAGAWEDVDWTVFDIVGVDYYRQGETEEAYRDGLRALNKYEKPVAVMEFGCCAYEGAAVRGGGGFMVLKGVNDDGSGDFEGDQVPVRSEAEQADYIAEQFDVFATENVHTAFVYVFSFPQYRYGDGARDLDMVSFSLVKTLPSGDPRSKAMPPWQPKLAFTRVAELFASHQSQ
ncbi:hypothetical protein AFM11_03135 [Mycolicibacterium wolinskyi]|uniref:Abortive infection protein n=1 Tax=Mycolicibacterium wolinskyi TaxID=59750 RepID=A0A132PSL2_9MYCO|nr:hypothetical protein [Mycolicibacterium wolinskyi]KWX25300.1 hypothetical protein AFM11_03135 [Mycolicibacterium wolinskyi]